MTIQGGRQKAQMASVSSFLTCALGLVPLALLFAQVARDTPVAKIGTGVISGVVMTDDTNSQPLRHAIVSLASGELRVPQTTMTDEAGRFVFVQLPEGNYTLMASRPAYVTTFYGAKKPGSGPGVPIAVVAGKGVTGISIRMLHGSAITGVIRNSVGQAAAGLDVQVLPVRMVDGQRRAAATTMLAVAALSGTGSSTDDRGVYRVFGLAPGDYIVQTQTRGILASGTAEARQVTPSEVQWAAQAASSATAGAPGAASVSLPPAPEPGPLVTYATVYYPGTTVAAQAAVVTVSANENREGIDFATQLVPTAKITGAVFDSDNQPSPGTQISLRASDSDGSDLVSLLLGGTGNSRSMADGKFTVTGVTPGRYTLTARATARPPGSAPGRAGSTPDMADIQVQLGSLFGGGGGAQVLWASEDITVDGRDISDLALRLQPGMTVSGKLVFEGTTLQPPADLTRARITVAPPPSGVSPMEMAMTLLSSMSPATTSADGTFAVKGLTPGKYKLGVNVPGMLQSPTAPGSGWVLKSATIGGPTGVDVADRVLELKPGQDMTGLVITMTDRPTEISGVVQDQAGRPAPGFPILIFSTDRTFWTMGSRRVLQARPSSDGKYRLVGLPAGEYFVAAVTDIDPNQLYDPVFLDQFAAASFKITLADGEKKTQDLKLGG
jgi:Carboxypeptidase regulatory-like domain